MAKWLTRTLVQDPRNGTTGHTINFTAATSGNLLVAVAQGAVTLTTPTGWTLPTGGSAVGTGGLYVWHKTAAAAESSFTTTANGSDRPIVAVVYEFAAGSTFVKAAAATAQAIASGAPTAITALTGTNLLIGAIGKANNATSGTVATAWTLPSGVIEDTDSQVLRVATDGDCVGIAYVEDSVATSFSGTSSTTIGNGTGTLEKISFAVNVATGVPQGSATGTNTWAGTAAGASQRRGTATGATTWAGTASGSSQRRGVATGAALFAGAAIGAATMSGTATGANTWTGSATGTTNRAGAATGATAWTGSVIGATNKVGAATGVTTWTGSASGAAPSVGAAQGTATGATVWAGSATGSTARRGTAAATYTFTGAASGTTSKVGTAAGAWTLTGSAAGTAAVPPVVRDPQLTLTLPASNLTLTLPDSRLEIL